MSNTITTAAELDALPEGEAVIQTPGGLWIKGSGTNWHRPLRAGETKVRSSTYLEQVGNLTLIAPLSDAARLRTGIEALADEWEERGSLDVREGRTDYVQGSLDAYSRAALETRALLSADAEKETRA